MATSIDLAVDTSALVAILLGEPEALQGRRFFEDRYLRFGLCHALSPCAWAGKKTPAYPAGVPRPNRDLGADDLLDVRSEEELRRKAAIPGVSLTYSVS